MVGMVLRVADVVGGGSGVYPLSSDRHRLRVLLNLRGGAQFQPRPKFRPQRSVVCRDRLAARRRRHREGPVRILRAPHLQTSCHVAIPIHTLPARVPEIPYSLLFLRRTQCLLLTSGVSSSLSPSFS